jgi:alcohol dehydrogenase (NADP+)
MEVQQMSEATQTATAQQKSQSQEKRVYTAKAYAAGSPASGLAAATIRRRQPTPDDVQIEILYCGICHSDLHQVRNEWSGVVPTVYPCVPGHEIVGRVTEIGAAVSKFKPGDLAAVGCMVDSDRVCPECQAGLEQFCPNFTLTYNFPDKHLGGLTYGGYSESIVVDQRFVLHVPSNLQLAGAAPLLCAGITTYSPMRHWGVAKGKKVGIAGLGGLGHMGVKFAHALGAHVVVFSTSPKKKEDALRLGADEVVISRNAEEMQKHAGSFDFILDAVSADHDINAYINLLRRDGNLTLVGAPEKPLAVSAFGLLMGRRSLSGSPIGGIRETQEMLDFCGQHNITADVEVIPIQKVNEAYERLLKSDVKYRFSIDMASLKRASRIM